MPDCTKLESRRIKILYNRVMKNCFCGAAVSALPVLWIEQRNQKLFGSFHFHEGICKQEDPPGSYLQTWIQILPLPHERWRKRYPCVSIPIGGKERFRGVNAAARWINDVFRRKLSSVDSHQKFLMPFRKRYFQFFFNFHNRFRRGPFQEAVFIRN